MGKLWQKHGQRPLHESVERYTVGDDPLLDAVLLPFDIAASKAHARGLYAIGILTRKEASQLVRELEAIRKDAAKGKVTITNRDEDCHTVIENWLTAALGDTGKKIHAGRSRNDQVLVAMRLYMRDQLDAIARASLRLARSFLQMAKTHRDVPLPGYSHTQQAMLSSIGHYACAYAESVMDDVEFLLAVRTHINRNPLGSAAGFGVAFPLDRKRTTGDLGFGAIQMNSLYCQNSRGKFESVYLESLVQLLMTLGKFASDLLLFTSQEFQFFSVDDSLATGSSIMPQKKNLDGLEILRGNVSVLIANQHLTQDIAKSLISGYHRDMQLMKKAVIESSRIALHSVEIARLYAEGIVPNEEAIRSKISKGIFMADIANALVQEQNIPFREAYRIAESRLDTYEINYKKNIRSKKSPGSPGNLGLDLYEHRLQRLLKRVQ